MNKAHLLKWSQDIFLEKIYFCFIVIVDEININT